MEGLYRWIGSIVSYLVFVTVLVGLLPAARYERYLRLFAGCILILLFFQPLTAFFDLDEPLEQLFRRVSLQEEAYGLAVQKSRGLEEKRGLALDRLEEKKLDLLFSEYERETVLALSKLAEEEGLRVLAVQAEVERSPESPDFAKIKRILIRAENKAASAAENDRFGREDEYAMSAGASEAEEIFIAPVTEIEVNRIAALAPEREEIEEQGRKQEAEIELEEEENQAAGSTNVRAASGKESVSGKKAEKELTEKTEAGGEQGKKETARKAAEKKREQSAESVPENRQQKLRKQIAAYYQVEEAYVEIRVED